MDKIQMTELLKYSDSSELLSLSKKGLAELFGSQFALMKGYSQNNPHHCYDLLEHTAVTVASLDLSGLSEEESEELKIAALYHDIGKPNVAREKDGRTVFYNHEKESSKITEKILTEAGLEADKIKKICFFIEYHGAFISYKSESELEKGFTHKYIRPITAETVKYKVAEIRKECLAEKKYVPGPRDLDLLLRLCSADAKAQSETVFQNGRIIDTREKKCSRLEEIRILLERSL